MKRKMRKFLTSACALAVGLFSLFAVGCSSCSDKKETPPPPAVDKLLVFDVASEEYEVGSDRTRILPEYLPEATVGGKTGEYLKLKTVTSQAGGVDFMPKPAFDKAHYEGLAAEKNTYVVTFEFYLDITFQGEETDANGKVSGIYMWSSVFGINEGVHGYPQRDTGWYTYSIRLSDFIEQYETVEKLYTGRRSSGVTYSILHTHSNIPMDYDFYIKDIVITEDNNLPPDPEPATPEMIINPTDVTSPQLKVGESWKENLSSEDLTVVKTQVGEVNGNTGDFTKYSVTLNEKGNARFDVKFRKLPANDLENYKSLAEENPDLQVKLYVYVDSTKAFHPDHETNPEKAYPLKLVSDIQSPMFGVEKFNGKDIYGTQYEYTKVLSLTDWIALNYEGISFRNYAIFGAGFSDTAKAGSVLDVYLSLTIGDFRVTLDNAKVLDTTKLNKNTFKVGMSWGTIETADLGVVTETATEANARTGEYVKHTVTFNKQGNALFKLTAMTAMSYDDYTELATTYPNLRVKLYMYVDASQVFHPDKDTNPDKAAALKMNADAKSAMFGVTENITELTKSAYEYKKVVTLSEWLETNFVEGKWQNNALFEFGASDTIKAGSVLKVYTAIELLDFTNPKIVDTASTTDASFEVALFWEGIETSDLTVQTEQATEANGKTGDYVKQTITFNEQGNSLFGIRVQPWLDYADYQSLALSNPNWKVKLTAYIDATKVVHPTQSGSLLMNTSVKSNMFGVTQSVTGLETSAYEYEKEITLTEWLELNYTNGVWQNKTLLSFGANNTIKVGSELTCYFSIALVEAAE